MKTRMKSLMVSSLLVASVLLAISCQKDDASADNVRYASILDVSEDGTSAVIEENLKSAFIENSVITDDELTTVLKMKEEEKFARDVYDVLYQKWGSRIFSNISSAETNHLNAVILLLQNLGSTETSVGDAGVFADPELQSLYNDLVIKGSESLEEAYKAGALIEEMDIKDLTESLNVATNENVILVYENLLRGSRNHLRAFNRQLTTLGVTYTPQFISLDEYTQITSSGVEKGKQYKMQGNCNGNGNFNGKQQRKGKGRN